MSTYLIDTLLVGQSSVGDTVEFRTGELADPRLIDYGDLKPGQRRYLIGHSDVMGRRGDTLEFVAKPGRTNQSGEARVWGWLGTTNGHHQEAMGLWEILAVDARTVRARLIQR